MMSYKIHPTLTKNKLLEIKGILLSLRKSASDTITHPFQHAFSVIERLHALISQKKEWKGNISGTPKLVEKTSELQDTC